MPRTLLSKERVSGTNTELFKYNDGYQESIQRPEGYFNDNSTPANDITTADNSSTGTNIPKVKYNSDGTRSVLDTLMEENKPLSKAEFEAQNAQTKSEYSKMLQDRISAIENMYVGIISSANERGKDKLGSANVINALAGQRGSASGARNIDEVNKANNDIMQNILAEKQSKIQSIMDQNYKDQSESLAKARELRQTDLGKYIDYLGQSEKDKITKNQKMRADLIAGGIKLEDIDNDTLKAMADSAGYSVDQFKALYNSELKGNQDKFVKDEQKRIAELAKTEAETAKLKAEADPVQKQLLAKGYTPITNPKDLQGLTEQDIIRIGEDIYRKPLSENLGAKVLLKKTTAPKSSSQKKTSNYTATTIPADLKKSLVEDISSKKFGKEQVYGAYPEVSTSYIDSLMK